MRTAATALGSGNAAKTRGRAILIVIGCVLVAILGQRCGGEGPRGTRVRTSPPLGEIVGTWIGACGRARTIPAPVAQQPHKIAFYADGTFEAQGWVGTWRSTQPVAWDGRGHWRLREWSGRQRIELDFDAEDGRGGGLDLYRVNGQLRLVNMWTDPDAVEEDVVYQRDEGKNRERDVPAGDGTTGHAS